MVIIATISVGPCMLENVASSIGLVWISQAHSVNIAISGTVFVRSTRGVLRNSYCLKERVRKVATNAMQPRDLAQQRNNQRLER